MRATLRLALATPFLFLLFLSLAASAENDRSAQLLVYRVTEPAGEPYISRILVTEDFLRMDQGQEDDGFILLDRKQEVIYSVNGDDRTILQLDPERGERTLPPGMQLQARIIKGQEMPTLPGRKTEYWGFYVNGELCRSAVVAPELMPGAVRAYGEYLELLAFQHYATQAEVPAELQDSCDQAVYIFEPLAVLIKGLPLREWGKQGVWELIDYREEFKVSSTGFVLPEDFQRIPLRERQEGL